MTEHDTIKTDMTGGQESAGQRIRAEKKDMRQ